MIGGRSERRRGVVRALALVTVVAIGGAIVAARAPAPRRHVTGRADDGQWTMPGKDYGATRFAALDQITGGNVAQLHLAWTFSTGFLRGHEGAPIVANNTMYLVSPYPNVLYALDLTQPGAPLKWSYAPTVSASSQGEACCDVVNRGGVFDDGKIFYNTLDAQTVAVDANSGKEVWRTRVYDFAHGETMTMAPLVADGKVFVGNSGGEMGVHGAITALDEGSGRLLWRAYSTGPDSVVKIGADFKPWYAADRRPNLGESSWPSGAWQIGGGAVWGWVSYDPQLGLIYYGTSNPGPWNPEQRPGDNKWTSSAFARRTSDGGAVWAYQMNPHDEHDYDGINEFVLFDATIGGRARHVAAHPDRNGYVYLWDRTTGELLSAKPFVYVNTIKSVDLKTGLPEVDAQYAPVTGRAVRGACPAPPGGKDWQPSAYSPRTGLLYIPTNNLCYDNQATRANYIAGTPYVGMNAKMYAGPGGNRGEFIAWDPVNGRKVWGIKEKFPVWSGALVTSADLVFYGTMDGWFKAVDARNGTLLWQRKLGSGIVGQPVAYRGPDGKEYVAVLAGVGGWSGAVVAGDLDPRDPTAALGFANAMADLKKATSKGGMLYVFSLP